MADFGMVAVVVVGFVITAIVSVIVGRRRQRQRAQQFAAWAQQSNWALAFRPTTNWHDRLPGGRCTRVDFAFSAAIGGRVVCVAECHYTEPEEATHTYTVVVVWLRRPFHRVSVRRRGELSKLGQRLFSEPAAQLGPLARDFQVDADDLSYASYLITPPIAEGLVNGWIPPWNVLGNELMAYHERSISDPAEVPQLAVPMLRLADLLDPPPTSNQR